MRGSGPSTGTTGTSTSWSTWAGGMAKRYGPTMIKAAGAAYSAYRMAETPRNPSPRTESLEARRKAREAYAMRRAKATPFESALIGRQAGGSSNTRLGTPTLIGSGQT